MWLARDRSGELYIYENKPYKDEKNGIWTDGCTNVESEQLCVVSFHEVRWEDEEPRELILKPLEGV